MADSISDIPNPQQTKAGNKKAPAKIAAAPQKSPQFYPKVKLTNSLKIRYFFPFDIEPSQMASNTNGGVPSSFESAISEIDSLVQSLETGKLPLDQALAGYERGAELIRYCQKTLTSAEQKIQILESGLLQNYVPSKTSEDADEDE